ncbi:MAG TPA: hypothetical protein VHR66_19410 [Gemmataceae bacterium]|nr:hypothetical protein [Gemmataceae bacterium]
MADTKPMPEDDMPDGATEELVAYLDGELDDKAAESFATRLTLDSKLRAEADALQRAWDILDVLPRPQPTGNFATRTLSQVLPVSLSTSGTQIFTPSGPAAATMPAMPPARPATGFWLTSLFVILVAGIGGYLGHREFAPAPKPVVPEPSLDDVPLMKNLRLYRNIDDSDYLKKLDSPDLFGDEGD